jgi:hypothetical protein
VSHNSFAKCLQYLVSFLVTLFYNLIVQTFVLPILCEHKSIFVMFGKLKVNNEAAPIHGNCIELI